MSKGIKKKIQQVRAKITAELHASYDPNNLYSVVNQEGYDGGYGDCLDDIQLALNGITPDRRWWKEE